MFKGSDRLMQ